MIYFDNSATTPLCEGAINGINEAIVHFGNPSSTHIAGQEANRLKDAAREALLGALSARKEQYEVIFTSGGTEANNLAVFGAAGAKHYKNPKIITTDSEHPCILEPCKRLESSGYRVVRLRTCGGRIDKEQFLAEMDESVVLVSVMSVNNETGAVYDTAALFSEARKRNPNVICHTDAVQALLKIPLTAKSTGADMISVSAHKIHGPKGCGALVVSKEIIRRKALAPHICGGGQENGLRSGTENMIGIAGFGGALREKCLSFEEDRKKTAALKEYIKSNLPQEVRPNLPPDAAPHILSLTLPQIKSETALNFLSGMEICVSAGSACANNGRHKSYVLSAFGLSDREIDSTLRISFSGENTKEEADLFLAALGQATETLVRFR